MRYSGKRLSEVKIDGIYDASINKGIHTLVQILQLLRYDLPPRYEAKLLGDRRLFSTICLSIASFTIDSMILQRIDVKLIGRYLAAIFRAPFLNIGET